MSDAVREGVNQRNRCPSCNAKLDAAAVPGQPDELRPNDGDLTICAYCATVLVFERGRTRTATRAELMTLPPEAHAQVARVRMAIKLVHDDRKRS